MPTGAGTWADWFSAIGSIGAVITALWLAQRDSRRAARKAISDQNEFMAQILMIADAIVALADRSLETLKPDNVEVIYYKFREALKVQAATLEILNRGTHPNLFATMGIVLIARDLDDPNEVFVKTPESYQVARSAFHQFRITFSDHVSRLETSFLDDRTWIDRLLRRPPPRFVRWDHPDHPRHCLFPTRTPPQAAGATGDIREPDGDPKS